MEKNKIINGIIIGVLVLAVVFYYSISINLSQKVSQTSKILIIQCSVDDKANTTFKDKYIEGEDLITLRDNLDNYRIFYGIQDYVETMLPYLPITYYMVYISVEGEGTYLLSIVEDGKVEVDSETYYSWDGKKLFRLFDELFNEID